MVGAIKSRQTKTSVDYAYTNSVTAGNLRPPVTYKSCFSQRLNATVCQWANGPMDLLIIWKTLINKTLVYENVMSYVIRLLTVDFVLSATHACDRSLCFRSILRVPVCKLLKLENGVGYKCRPTLPLQPYRVHTSKQSARLRGWWFVRRLRNCSLI